MTQELKATMSDDADIELGNAVAAHRVVDPDELLAEEQERRKEEDQEQLERRTKAAKYLRDRAEALVAQAADMRERAELLDPAPCAGGAPRKPADRKGTEK